MADTNNSHHHHDPSQDRFERRDADFVKIGGWMVIILILLLMTAFAVWGYFDYFTQKQHAASYAKRSPLLVERDRPGNLATVQEIPGLQLQVNPAATMRIFAAGQQKSLDEYSWVSREAGVVRLPIEAAKKKVIDSGILKSRSAEFVTTSTITDDGASLPQDSSSGRTFWNLQR